MMISVFAVGANAAELTSAQKSMMKLSRADADGDGTYTTADAVKLLRMAAGIEKSTEANDVNLDGYVAISDAVLVLRETAGVGAILSTAEALELFNNSVNTVKKQNPGFTKATTIHCSSMLITTTGAPAILSDLNVKNMEYRDYVNRVVSVMSKYSWLITDEKEKAELDKQMADMKQSAIDAYKPQTQSYEAPAGDVEKHRSYFPISNVDFSSNLGVNDVASVKVTMKNKQLVYTVAMDDYKYIGNEYPTGTAGLAGRLQLPYGKVFNLIPLDESDGSVVNSMSLKNGKVVLTQNASTGKLVKADYSYDYISDVNAPDQDNGDNGKITMKSVIKTNVKESVTF